MFNWFKKDKQKEDVKPKADHASSHEAIEALDQQQEQQQQEQPAQHPQKPQDDARAASALLQKEQAFNVEEKDVKTTEDKSSAETLAATEEPTKTDELITPEELAAPKERIASEEFIEPEELAEPEESAEPEKPEVSSSTQSTEVAENGFFARLRSSLSRTKANIGSGFVALLKGKAIDDELYEDLETQLLVADVGMNTTTKIIEQLTEKAKLSQLKDGDALANLLKQQMREILEPVSVPLSLEAKTDENGQKQPFVILMVGVNGVGKTTTIGKLAKQFQREGKKVMLAAGDTFRAAAVEQLQVWGERNNIGVIAQPTGADSASVIFDAVASAKAKGVDVLIADTAGRLQNKDNLIEELKKVVRVMKKQIPEAPHEIMLTLDASTGQNAVSQTKIFNEAVGITGINLSKLDGTAKGGVIFALADEFNIPVRYIGIGEGIDDLRAFEAKAFVDALFDEKA